MKMKKYFQRRNEEKAAISLELAVTKPSRNPKLRMMVSEAYCVDRTTVSAKKHRSRRQVVDTRTE